MVAIACLVLVILFGYMNDNDDKNNDDNPLPNQNDNQEPKSNNQTTTSTLLVILTAIPLCFPFIMAAFLNCHVSATISKIVTLCRTQFEERVSEAEQEDGVHYKVHIEQIESVSNEDEVMNKILIEISVRTHPLPSQNSKDTSSSNTTTTTTMEQSLTILSGGSPLPLEKTKSRSQP
jgi:hypothetical protein